MKQLTYTPLQPTEDGKVSSMRRINLATIKFLNKKYRDNEANSNGSRDKSRIYKG